MDASGDQPEDLWPRARREACTAGWAALYFVPVAHFLEALRVSWILPRPNILRGPVGDMLSWFRQLLLCCLLEAALLWGGAFGQLESKFETCKLRFGRILNGTETFRGINNET